MKRYKIKATKELKEKLIPFFKRFEKIENNFCNDVEIFEKRMEKETGIKGIEFFFSDGEMVGIGNAERTMELIHRP